MTAEPKAIKLPSGPEGKRSLGERAAHVAAVGYAFYLRYMGLGADDETNVFIAKELLNQTGNKIRSAGRKLGL